MSEPVDYWPGLECDPPPFAAARGVSQEYDYALSRLAAFALAEALGLDPCRRSLVTFSASADGSACTITLHFDRPAAPTIGHASE